MSDPGARIIIHRVMGAGRMFMDWLKKAPTSVTIAVIALCGVLAIVIVAAYTVLTLNGQDTTEFRQWVQTIGQLLVYPLIGTSAVASVAAARSASAAEDQTNGQLSARDQKIEMLQAQLNAARAAGFVPPGMKP